MTNATQVPYEPELVQMLLGNMPGQYDLGELEIYAADQLRQLAKQVGLSPGPGFDNGVFQMRTYYRGDCTCGYDEKELDWSEDHPHSDNCFYVRRKAFEKKLEDEGVEPYSDKWVQKIDEWARENGWESGFTGSASHCDCPHQQAWKQFASENSHDEECPTVLPNFRRGSIEIRWYKHIGRGMSINRKVTKEELQEAFRRCRQSLAA